MSRHRLLTFSLLLAVPLVLAANSTAAERTVAPSSAATPSATARTSAGERPDARVAELIKQLGDAQYFIRQRAQEELSRIGADAFDALTAAESSDDIEVASRARYLVQLIRIDLVRDADSSQAKSILQDYEMQDDNVRLARAQQLGNLPHDSGVEPLCRLVRFERSSLLSKLCALQILSLPEPVGSGWAARAQAIETGLGSSRRPGARWLQAYVRFHSDPDVGMAEWDRLVEQESSAAQLASVDSSPDIAQELQRRQVAMLLKLKYRDRALAVMRKVIALESGEPRSLMDSTEWLVKQQAWEIVAELGERFADKFNSEPALLYMLALARQSQGQAGDAEETAKRAFALVQSKPAAHLDIASILQSHGAFDWSESEYRHALETTKPESPENIYGRYLFSEMLHDQQRDLQAAEVLKDLVDAMSRNPAVLQAVQQLDGKTPGPESIRSRMHYFYACHYGAQNDAARQLEALDEGIAADPTDSDVLIALYRTSADDPERRKQALKLIGEAAEQFRGAIADASSPQLPYNNYAWLIGNTEGDIDLAIQYSHKSVELRPDSASLLDTLAHCYAAKGDYASAVQYQTRSAELEPHTQQIARALVRFKAGLAKASKN